MSTDPRERVRRPRAQRLERQDEGFAEWWYRLDQNDVPRKIWLHNGGHGGPGGPGERSFKAAENRWMDHELFGVRNGIMREPRSTIQREDGSYTTA